MGSNAARLSWTFLLLSSAMTVRAAPIAIRGGTQRSDYEKAVALVQQGQIDQALPVLRRILDQSPTDLKARNLIGIALSAAGRTEEANTEFEKALQVDPKFVPALKNLAVNEMGLGKTDDAKVHFEQAVELAPGDSTCHLGLAEIAFSAHDFEKAAAEYDKSGDVTLRRPQTTIKFAASCVESKRLDKAEALLARLPFDADANTQFQAGILLARLEEFEPAARRFELARKEGFPDPYQVGFNLTLVYVKGRNFDAAIKAGQELATAGYRKAELYNLLAQAYDGAGKAREAYEALRTATGIDPEDETNYLDLITLCLKTQDYKLGLEIAGIGLRLLPKSHRLHLERGVVLAMNSQFTEAEQEFQISESLSPKSGLAGVAMGMVLIQMDKVPEAIEVLRHESEKSPNNPEVFWFLGEALNRSGAPPGSDTEKRAVEALKRSISLDARLAEPRALLGKILLRRGDVTGAIEQLQKAIELDPDDITATYQLAQALKKQGNTTRAAELFAKVEKAKIDEGDSVRRNLLRIGKEGSQ
ncbi:MAG TPA: tetratricopeptide repeat protein [Blastocatellia bacterium]|nr:tetratricopeptide repeat protein [Blastocatellia bacterium]